MAPIWTMGRGGLRRTADSNLPPFLLFLSMPHPGIEMWREEGGAAFFFLLPLLVLLFWLSQLCCRALCSKVTKRRKSEAPERGSTGWTAGPSLDPRPAGRGEKPSGSLRSRCPHGGWREELGCLRMEQVQGDAL